jgi:uncharacterized protein
MTMEGKIIYFSNPGQENTGKVLRIAKIRAEELGIKTVIIASATGETAVKATKILKGIRVVAVSLFTGYEEPNVQMFSEENRQKVIRGGGVVLTSVHALSGIARAFRKKFSMYMFEDTIANTLRIFGQGMKVACEITLMAADVGLVRTDEDVIAIGGTEGGSDTAIVLRPVNCADFFDLQVKEILCKPHF